MRKTLNYFALAFAAATLVSPFAAAQAQLMDAVKGQLGGLGQSGASNPSNAAGLGGMSLSSLSSGSMGNVAGVIEFCMKNNYLNADTATANVKDKLLGKLSGTTPQTKKTDTGYLAGLSGMLTGQEGQSVDLKGGGIKQELTRKACDQVLKQGKSLL